MFDSQSSFPLAKSTTYSALGLKSSLKMETLFSHSWACSWQALFKLELLAESLRLLTVLLIR